MEIKLSPASLKGRVDIPGSKSYAHRMLTTAAFSHADSVLSGDFSSDDMKATLRVLTALGARIQPIAGGVKVMPAVIPERATADCGESGSTLRFAVPVSAALGIQTTFIGSKRLGERPMEELFDCLSEHGIEISGRGLPFTLSGKLTAGDYSINAARSSQFVTGLLLALPLLNGDSTLTVHGEASKAYIDITLDVLNACGAQISRQDNTFFIRGGGYNVSGEKRVEGDWSNAAFWMVAGIFGEQIDIGNLNGSSRQGDRRVAELLRQAGGDVFMQDGYLTAKRSSLHAIEFDADDIPDAVPAMSVALAAASGTSAITGVKRLRLKESDRLTAVLDMLTRLGVPARYDGQNDALIITGIQSFNGAALFSYNDHRLAMAGAVAALRARSCVTLSGAEAVNKSYPAFFSDYQSLGGKICRLPL